MSAAVAVTEPDFVVDSVATRAIEQVTRPLCTVAKGQFDEYLPEGINGDRYAFTADQAVLRRYLADAAGTLSLRFRIGEL